MYQSNTFLTFYMQTLLSHFAIVKCKYFENFRNLFWMNDLDFVHFTFRNMSTEFRLTYSDILAAENRISSYIHETPVFTSSTLNRAIGRKVFFKAESFQKTGSFKARGALNAVILHVKGFIIYIHFHQTNKKERK